MKQMKCDEEETKKMLIMNELTSFICEEIVKPYKILEIRKIYG